MLEKVEPPQWFMIGWVILELLKLVYAKLDSENKIYQSVQELAKSAVAVTEGQKSIAKSMETITLTLVKNKEGLRS